MYLFKRICALALAFGAVFFFSACAHEVIPRDADGNRIRDDITGWPMVMFERDVRNLVDERYELVSLVFRLAGRPDFSHINTSYQALLLETFVEFADHPAVTFAQWMFNPFSGDTPLGDVPLNLAVHLQRAGSGFELTNNIEFLISCGRWPQNSVIRFVELLNDFYQDTNFTQFFQANMEYFMEISENFTQEVYSAVNKDWFRQFGVNPDDLRIVLVPSISYFSYGASVWPQGAEAPIRYAAIANDGISPHDMRYLVIHNFIHSFSSPLGDLWYAEDEEFRNLNDSVVGSVGANEAYSTGLMVAQGHLSRAFTVKYYVENHDDVQDFRLLTRNIGRGFPHIVHTFDLITAFERENIATLMRSLDINIVPPTTVEQIYRRTYVSEEIIAAIGNALGIDEFEFGHEFTALFRWGRSWWYQVYVTNMDLSIEELSVSGFASFPTEQGDIIFVIEDLYAFGGENSYFLLIDVGPGPGAGLLRYRASNLILLN